MTPHWRKPLWGVLTLVFVVHWAVFGWRGLTVERLASFDSWNYIAVARNLSAGRGFVQSSVGFNQPGLWGADFSPEFAPRTRHTQSVGYPLIIAAAAWVTGLAHVDAAYVISGFSYGIFLVVMAALAFRIGGMGAAFLTLATLPVLLRDIFWYPWTEPLTLALLAGVLLLLVGPLCRQRALLAGVLTGLILMMRLPMLPLLLVGALACYFPVVVIQNDSPARRWQRVAAFVLSALAFVLLSRLVGEGHSYATLNWHPTSPLGVPLQYLLRQGPLLILLPGLLALALWRWRSSLADNWWQHSDVLLAVWICAYSGFLMASSMFFHIDPVYGSRLAAPAMAAAVALSSGLLGRLLYDGRVWRLLSQCLVLIVLLTMTAMDVHAVASRKAPTRQQIIAHSPWMQWVAAEVGPDDFLIGDLEVHQVPYHFPNLSVVAIPPYPYGPHVTLAQVDAVVRARCGRYRNFYLALSAGNRATAEQASKNLAPGVDLLATAGHVTIYRMQLCP